MTPAQILAQVWADPGDIALRAVVADALQLAGDLRGEFIALQLAIADGTAPREAHLRAKELLAKHADAWAGGLPIEPRYRRFARGFLTAAKFAGNTTPGHILATTLEQPEWSTLEELDAPGMVEPGPLLRRMPLLHTLATTWGDPIGIGESTFPAIRALACADWIPADRRVFPSLAVLALTVQRHDAITALLERARALDLHALVLFGISSLWVTSYVRARAFGPPRLRLLSREPEFLFEPHAPFKPPRYRWMRSEPDNWRIQLYRDRDEADLDAEVGATPMEIYALLEQSGISRINLRPVDLRGVD